MRKLLIILCIVIVGMLVMKYLASNKEKAARATANSLLSAVKEKDVDRAMEYLDYDAVVSELDMWAKIGGGNFTAKEARAQLKKNLEEGGEFDYEIIDAEARDGGEVKVTVQIKEDGEVADCHLIMKKKDEKWKCDLMATGEEAAKIEKERAFSLNQILSR